MNTYTIRGWEGTKIKFDGVMVTVICPTCSIINAIPKEQNDRAHHWKDEVWIYCSNGHGWSYTKDKSAEEALRADVKRLEKEAANAWNQALDAANTAKAEKRAHSVTKGLLTKAVNRAAAGGCIYCQREFANVARHMASKHSTTPAAPAPLSDHIEGKNP